MIVIDASVAVKWFLPEPLSDAAERVIAGNETRIAPEHILVEVGQALLRAVRAGSISLDHAREGVVALGDLVQLLPTGTLAVRAVEIAAEAACTNYDALYVAAAERWEARLLTADKRLYDRLLSTRWNGCARLLGEPDTAA